MSSYSGEMWDIVEDACKELREWAEKNPHGDENEKIVEIADSSTPVYNYDRMKIGMENLDLACTDSELGGTNAADIMGEVIYQAIQEALAEEWMEIEREREMEDEEEDLEEEGEDE